jgi:hypothetical protein
MSARQAIVPGRVGEEPVWVKFDEVYFVHERNKPMQCPHYEKINSSNSTTSRHLELVAKVDGRRGVLMMPLNMYREWILEKDAEKSHTLLVYLHPKVKRLEWKEFGQHGNVNLCLTVKSYEGSRIIDGPYEWNPFK